MVTTWLILTLNLVTISPTLTQSAAIHIITLKNNMNYNNGNCSRIDSNTNINDEFKTLMLYTTFVTTATSVPTRFKIIKINIKSSNHGYKLNKF